ncbi:DEAD/DEAH box helicase [candidate division KSB1 bacterium]|nr:DEAD/DEAH box helicase [candidate division KSB1 bacterium]RQW02397.1 MAG: DEAD/DEAH box helicase [candidate division KSB1 bacterium]
MPVQARIIPYLLEEKDVAIQARTGSGKTGAFLLPMIERLNAAQSHCQALILVPTRELANQVWQDSQVLFKDTHLQTVAVYGGVGYAQQINALKGGVQVVVGTPGRVLDHLLKGVFSLSGLKMLIFDEADRMLSMGFYPDMKKVQKFLPKKRIHTCMFSATFPSHVLNTAREFIREPEFISLSKDHTHVTEVEHVYYIVPGMDKDRALIRIIEVENPASAIIFCNTKSEVHYVCTVLQRFGYDADELTSDLVQSKREQVLKRIRNGTLRYLVATDVAARGLDIPELSHVIQYETPEDFEAYIHRSGRTGRAGASGVAITLVTTVERMQLERIARRYDIDMQLRSTPADADVEKVVSERVTALLEARLRDRDKLKIERSQRFLELARTLAENEDESAIIAMLVDDFYQHMLHEPLVKSSEQPEPSAKNQLNRKKTTRRKRPGGKYRSKQE